METAKLKDLIVTEDFLAGEALAADVVNQETGEIIFACNAEITHEMLAEFVEQGVTEFQTIYTNDLDCGPFVSDTLRIDGTTSKLEAMVEIYRMMRPGEPPIPANQKLQILDRFNVDDTEFKKLDFLRVGQKYKVLQNWRDINDWSL